MPEEPGAFYLDDDGEVAHTGPTVRINLTDEMLVDMWTAVAHKAVYDDQAEAADLKRLLSASLDLIEALKAHIHELEGQ